MSKGIFESEVGSTLREATAPVPANAWAAISAHIPKAGSGAASVPKSPFLFSAAVGVILLGALASYSALHERAEPLVAQSQIAKMENGNIRPIEIQEEPAQSSATESLTLGEEAEAPNKSEKRVIVLSQSEQQQGETDVIIHRVEAESIDTQSNVLVDRRQDEGSRSTMTPVTLNPGTLDQKVDDRSAMAGADYSTPVAAIKCDVRSGYAPLTVKFESKSESNTYKWEFGYAATSTERKAEVLFEEPGVYTVYLTAQNEIGETDADFVQITVKEGSFFNAPNSFTPNGDGLNDTYKIERAINISDFLMIITDQNGDVVFQTRNIKEEWKYDRSLNNLGDTRYFVTYRAVGIDGKVHAAERMQLNIFP